MATVADAERKPGRKTGKMKEAWEARALMDKYGFKTIAAMEAALAGVGPAVTSEEPTSVLPDERIPASRPMPDEWPASSPAIPAAKAVEVSDPLGWITRDTGAVHLVSRYQNLVIRPPRYGVQPPMDAIVAHEYGRGEWAACPFDMRSRDREQEILNWVHYGRWAYVAISRDMAEVAYGDPRWPLPEKAVIVPAEFGGWDRFGNQARGVLRPLVQAVPLREAVRRCLQRFIGEVFVNATYHREMHDVRIANPYGNRLAGLSLRLPTVQTEGATP